MKKLMIIITAICVGVIFSAQDCARPKRPHT